MNLAIIRRHPRTLVILSATVGLLVLTGCGSGTGQKVASNGAQSNAAPDNQGNAITVTSASPTTSGATSAANVSRPGETAGRGTRDNNDRQAANVPNSQIGTGGSDFFLFTQARGALLADDEFKTANITIDVKAGVLTLSGTIANAAQKTKAEQLVRGVSGIKSVKNQLRISSRQLT